MSKEVRIIKRYQNRKLYDTFQSCYVTLEEISQIIREGNEIQVIDNKSKNDITYMTQIQLLFDQERKAVKLGGDTELLKRVIRAEEGTLTGYIRKIEAERNKLLVQLGQEVPAASEGYAPYMQTSEINANATSTMIETSTTLN
ncbi:MAG: polyhydroxyalkanoate synthesis regulator DNA-binding domain-containing protein [Oligoflexia bacterium]|nr:polyhydroxyalkanoate synthesis regulator DNA-binding domain-containing protein [Oligoflexia bacterium]MBF0366625.1 polyhydroxyalkanoate synthesis regulator DNA-binding domain-containing protein [Oligoflexia bacterium]